MYPLVFGLGAAVVAMVGTNVGAGQVRRAIRIAWTAAAIATGITGAVGAVAIAWPQAWMLLFSHDPDVIASGSVYLVVAALGYAFIGTNTLTQAFQAMGRTLWPLLAVASRALILVAGGWIVIQSTDSGAFGLAMVTAVGLAVAGVLIGIAFRITTRARQETLR
jgi:Na+-driven multidrug efflux pump